MSDDHVGASGVSSVESVQAKTIAGMSRRAFAFGMGGAAACFALGGAVRVLPSKELVRPPGGQDEQSLVGLCIRCEKCYEACPHHVIRPARIEDGLAGMRMPQMTFDAAYCDFCEQTQDGLPLCVKACPTGALAMPEALASGGSAEEVVIGKAELNEETCLAYNLQGCRFCYDACPYEAMGIDENGRPYVIEDKCNGCGACESVCVSLKAGVVGRSSDERAIVVRACKEGEVL